MVTPSNNRLYKGKEFNPQQRGYRDTFVKPTTVVEQKRGALDVMTEALVAINPALNAIFSNQIKDAVREEKKKGFELAVRENRNCLLYTSPSPRDYGTSRMPSSA